MKRRRKEERRRMRDVRFRRGIWRRSFAARRDWGLERGADIVDAKAQGSSGGCGSGGGARMGGER